MADIAKLAAELAADPLARGYGTMTDAQVVTSLQTQNRPLDKKTITGDEAFAQTEAAGWTGLTDAEKAQWLAFCGRDIIDPFGAANIALVTALFGAGSATVTSLAAYRRTANGQTREQELGLGIVNVDDVATARA